MSDNPFKDYTHKRLDAMGVPVDPSPSVTASTGCRIHGRLDYVQLRMELQFCVPRPCIYCGVVVLKIGKLIGSINSKTNKVETPHLCKTSDIATFKKLKGPLPKL